MKAAVTVAPHHMEIQDIPEPVPGPGEALVKVEMVGICGTDLHFFEGENLYANYPQTQGHEFSGRVVAFGGPYHGPVQAGQRVAVEPLLPCGTCYPCRRGRPNCCTTLKVLGVHTAGAFAEYVKVPVDTLYPTTDLDAELTAIVEPMSIGTQVVTRGAVTAEDTVAIFGAGVIGQATLVAAIDRGARVLIVDRLASRLDYARVLGADRVVDATVEDPAKVIAEWTDGDGAAVVVDATGVPAVIRTAVDVVAFSGRIVIVGISLKEVSLPVAQFTRKELTILGSRNNARVFGEAVQLVQRWNDRLRVLITDRYALDDAPQAIARALHHPEAVQKVLLNVASW